MEGVESGTAKLVGTTKSKIIEEVEKLLNDDEVYRLMATANNPYGDGKSSHRILEILTNS
jgi:UDP-N-acetylglucosamine 2-epimerase (non-hydrolysing)